jgi:hypothetical protein
MPTRTTALFADRHATHAAVEQLVQAGFPRDAISVVMSEDTHEREFGARAAEVPGDTSGIRPARQTGVLGAIVSGMVVLALPNGLAVRGAGPLVPALLGAPTGGNGAVPASTASNLGEHEVHLVTEGVRGGSIVVGVHTTDSRAQLALQLLELSGGAALEAA